MNERELAELKIRAQWVLGLILAGALILGLLSVAFG